MARKRVLEQWVEQGKDLDSQQKGLVGKGVDLIRNQVEALRESPPAKTLDKVIEGLDQFLGTSGKAWLANGLDELRQAVALGNGQVQAGTTPGLWGTITTGEATAERMEGENLHSLKASYEVPEQNQEVTLEQLRGHVQQNSEQAHERMGRVRDISKEMER